MTTSREPKSQVCEEAPSTLFDENIANQLSIELRKILQNVENIRERRNSWSQLKTEECISVVINFQDREKYGQREMVDEHTQHLRDIILCK